MIDKIRKLALVMAFLMLPGGIVLFIVYLIKKRKL
jgi:hypothetical protein